MWKIFVATIHRKFNIVCIKEVDSTLSYKPLFNCTYRWWSHCRHININRGWKYWIFDELIWSDFQWKYLLMISWPLSTDIGLDQPWRFCWKIPVWNPAIGVYWQWRPLMGYWWLAFRINRMAAAGAELQCTAVVAHILRSIHVCGTDTNFASFHSFNLLNWLPRRLEIMDEKTIGFMRKHPNTSHLIINRVWIAPV